MEWELLIKKEVSEYEINKKSEISIACVLAYYNGHKYVLNQIQSIIDQKINNAELHIFISDDKSTEPFPDLKNINMDNINNLCIFYRKLEKNLGHSENFLYSLKSINSEYDFYCYSDQDDIWINNKLTRSIKIIKKLPNEMPRLYCGRTIYYDQNCENILGYSIVFKKNPSFKNALIQNIAGGNTMVFDKPAKDIIIKSLRSDINISSHDWWTYLLISGAGGAVYYDKVPLVKYRQHKNNIHGSNISLKGIIFRIYHLYFGTLRDWISSNIFALQGNSLLLTKENLFVLERFIKIRDKSIFKRFRYYKSLGIYRQTLIGNIAIFIAIIFRRV